MWDIIKVHVIDDDGAVRRSICALLTSHGYVAHPYASATEFLEKADLTHTGVVITDLAMPGISGEQLQQRLNLAGSLLTVLFVTGVADVRTAVRVMASGASTLLEKPFSDAELLAAVMVAVDRNRSIVKATGQQNALSQKVAGLSQDEREVLEGMLRGKPIKACARDLHLSTRTVERRRKAILEKTGAASIPELALIIGPLMGSSPPRATET